MEEKLRKRLSVVSRKTCNDSCDDLSIKQFRLKREIGLWTAVALLSGTIVGSGIFVSPIGVLVGTNGSVGISLILWAACGMVCGLAALCYAELGTSLVETGSSFIYLKCAYGEPLAFVYAISSVFLILTTGIAASAIVFGTYLSLPFYPGCGPPNVVVKCSGAAVLILIGFTNYISVKAGAKVQIVFTVAKFLAMLIIIFGGLTKLAMGNPVGINNFKNAFDSEKMAGLTAGQIGLAFYQGLFAYSGWANLNLVTEEIKDLPRNLPRAIIIALTSVTLFYVLVNISYLSVLTPEEMIVSSAVAVTFGDRVLGSFAWIMPVSVCLSIFGSLNGAILAGGRLAFAVARREHLPEILSMVHLEHYSPGPSIILNVGISVALMIPSDFNTLIKALSFTGWLFIGLCCAGVLILRRTKPNLDRPFKVSLVVPVIVSILSLYFVVAPLVDQPDLIFLYAALFMISTLILYFPFVYKKVRIRTLDPITVFLQKLLNVAPEN